MLKESTISKTRFQEIEKEIKNDYGRAYKEIEELFGEKNYGEVCPKLVKLRYIQTLDSLLENRKLYLEGHNLKRA